jgi:hypothetical protein
MEGGKMEDEKAVSPDHRERREAEVLHEVVFSHNLGRLDRLGALQSFGRLSGRV